METNGTESVNRVVESLPEWHYVYVGQTIHLGVYRLWQARLLRWFLMRNIRKPAQGKVKGYKIRLYARQPKVKGRKREGWTSHMGNGLKLKDGKRVAVYLMVETKGD